MSVPADKQGAGGIAPPAPLPAAWLNVTTGDRALRLRPRELCAPDATGARARDALSATHVQVTPLSLRETFIALAREERAASACRQSRQHRAAGRRSGRERRQAGAVVKLVAHLVRKDLGAVALVAVIWILLMSLEVMVQLTGA